VFELPFGTFDLLHIQDLQTENRTKSNTVGFFVAYTYHITKTTQKQHKNLILIDFIPKLTQFHNKFSRKTAEKPV